MIHCYRYHELYRTETMALVSHFGGQSFTIRNGGYVIHIPASKPGSTILERFLYRAALALPNNELQPTLELFWNDLYESRIAAPSSEYDLLDGEYLNEPISKEWIIKRSIRILRTGMAPYVLGANSLINYFWDKAGVTDLPTRPHAIAEVLGWSHKIGVIRDWLPLIDHLDTIRINPTHYGHGLGHGAFNARGEALLFDFLVGSGLTYYPISPCDIVGDTSLETSVLGPI